MANTVVYWMALMFIAVAVRSEEINILFHMHDVVVGSNRTAVPVGLGSILSPGFGAMVVIDDILTQQASPDSLLVGRAQGMYLSDSLSLITRPDLLLVFTAIFEWPAEYRGSTLSIQGADRIFMDKREVSVIGGTGKFRFARGFATIHTVSTSLLANAVLLFNVTVRVP